MGLYFDTVFLIILENQGFDDVKNCEFVKFFKTNGTIFNDWTAAGHPSGPNYRTLLSGYNWSWNEFDGVHRPNVGDSVPCVVNNFRGIPAERHNPFLDMQSKKLLQSPVPFFPVTVNKTVFNGIYYFGMDDSNDAHSGPLSTADSNTMEALKLTMNIPRAISFVIFDEAFGCEYFDNHVFAGVYGEAVPKGKLVKNPVFHKDFAVMLYNNWNIPIPVEIAPRCRNLSKPLWELD